MGEVREWRKEDMLAQALDIEGIFRRNADTVYRVCFTYLRAPADAEDVVQQVFMKLVANPRTFNDAEHEKAWLITCAVNACKDVLKSAHRTRSAQMPPDVEDPAKRDETLDAVLALEDPHRIAVYLHYYEGYKSQEIAQMLDANPSTVRNWISEAREKLRVMLGGE